jgi:hypothetical protein
VHDRLDVRAGAQDFGMNEHLVVARHGASHLAAFEIDRDDGVGGHLVEPDGCRLHQESLRIVGEPYRHVAGHEVALILARKHAPGIGQLSPQRFGHSCATRTGATMRAWSPTSYPGLREARIEDARCA